jgi:triosephosphate isomerase (TIM)
MRIPLVAGNWKMNTIHSSAVELAGALAKNPPAGKVEVAVCPPFVYLIPVAQAIAASHVKLGAQDVYFEAKGAFTGEISCEMLKDCCCEYVILGHSERRHVIGETDSLINAKLKAVVAAGLKPILCVGEKLEERDAHRTEAVVEVQLRDGLAGLTAGPLKDLVIAYEPVWAIGTGRNATPDQAQEVHRFIRAWIEGKLGGVFAQSVRIQYGGSVKGDNAESLLSQPDVDGALVGGASLKADEFLKIIRAGVAAKA